MPRRSRWAAIGAAVAVSLGAGFGSGVFRTEAAPNPAESTLVPVEPVRILDTRPSQQVGLEGRFVSEVPRDLQITGNIATKVGERLVVPAGAAAAVLNVTAVRPSVRGFISVVPGGTTEFTTSSLNFLEGEIRPNSVIVPLSDDGSITIVYIASPGADVDVLVDLVGYTTSVGLLDTQQRVTDLETRTDDLSDALPGTQQRVTDLETRTDDLSDAIDALPEPDTRRIVEAGMTGGDLSQSVGTTGATFATLQIPHEAGGTVLVNASLTARVSTSTPRLRCSISTTESVDSVARVEHDVTGYQSMSLTRGFEVGPPQTPGGTATFTAYLFCNTTTGFVSIFDPYMTATFVADPAIDPAM